MSISIYMYKFILYIYIYIIFINLYITKYFFKKAIITIKTLKVKLSDMNAIEIWKKVFTRKKFPEKICCNQHFDECTHELSTFTKILIIETESEDPTKYFLGLITQGKPQP